MKRSSKKYACIGSNKPVGRETRASICIDMKKTEYQFVNSINKMVIATSKNSVFTDTRRKKIQIQAKSKSHVHIMNVASANLAEMSASFGMACMRLSQ